MAVRVIKVPLAKFELHVVPHIIPAGLPVTVPRVGFRLLTVKVIIPAVTLKLCVTGEAAL